MNRAGERSLQIGTKKYKLLLTSSTELDAFLVQQADLSMVDAKGKFGVIDHHEQVVRVRADVHHDLIAEGIMHELIHVVIEECGAPTLFAMHTNDGAALCESFTSIVAPRIVDALRQNADVLREFGCLRSGD